MVLTRLNASLSTPWHLVFPLLYLVIPCISLVNIPYSVIQILVSTMISSSGIKDKQNQEWYLLSLLLKA